MYYMAPKSIGGEEQKLKELLLSEVSDKRRLLHQLERVLSDLRKDVYKEKQEVIVPLAVFSIRELPPLQALATFLHENKGLKYSAIAPLVGRDQRNIAAACKSARDRWQRRLPDASPIMIPLSALAPSSLPLLEAIVVHLKDTLGMNYHDIAIALARDDRTVWTAYNRSQKHG
ncbi:MAG: hypothetical protein QS99_C0017G0043 [archaeon GW2011_AR4]|nr:MAG: hypothetical protein QS99_C0017G0043 [archaeon GW2011_AR4]